MRKKVHQKYGGHCAYCGGEITIKQMHVDHKKPIFRGHHGVNPDLRGTEEIDNLMPACKPCNLWKSTMTIDEFRQVIAAQIERLRLRSANFRMAERYQLVSVIDAPVIFFLSVSQGVKGCQSLSECGRMRPLKKVLTSAMMEV